MIYYFVGIKIEVTIKDFQVWRWATLFEASGVHIFSTGY